MNLCFLLQSKVTKQVWVLKECVERVPETYGAARELLLFGLEGTDVETFISVADGEDFTCCITICQCVT
jgi:hypothetical protein